MSNTAIIKKYNEPNINEKEILRYAGCRKADDEVIALMRSCVEEAREKLSYNVCFRELDICSIAQDGCIDLGICNIKSADLAKNLRDCGRVIIFAGTLGIDIDRLIYKYGRISPSKALMMQAIGAERIEALCDTFCDDIFSQVQNVSRLKPRFSPGFGDLTIDVQKLIFDVLGCTKSLGMSLNESLLMSPSKSVTAFVGIVND